MKLHGPQDDRDKHWTGRWDPQRPDLSRKEVEAFEGELSRLRTENKTLRDQLNRSLKELKAYQVKYPSPYVPTPQEDDEGNLWTISPEAVNPLMEAYDTRILELEETVKQQLHKLETFKERMEILVTENEELRTKHLEELKLSEGGNNSGLGLANPLNQELLTQAQQNNQLLMNENAILTEEKVLLSTELDKHQQQLEKQYQELHMLTQKNADLQKELQSQQKQIQQAQTERDEAAKHALHCSDALGKAEQEIESLTEQLTLVKQKAKETDLEYQELKKQLKTMSIKYDEDGLLSVQKVKQAEERVKELHLKLSAKISELDNTNEVLRKLRGEYQTTRQDAEGMLQVMTSMERQLNEYASREEQINKLNSEARQKLEESLIIREQAAVKEEQSRREIERLLAERKAYLLQRQSDIDKAMEMVRRNVSEQIAILEKDIEELQNRNGELQFEAERSARECKSTREMFERLQRVYEEQQASAQENIQSLSEELRAASVAKETERALKIDVQEQNKELRLLIDRYRAQMENHRSQLQQVEKLKEQEIVALKQSQKETTKELNEKTRLLAKKQKDLDEITHQLDTVSLSHERRYSDELAILKTRLAEMDKINKELEAINGSNDMRLQMMVEQLKEKYNLQLLTVESKLKNEMDKNKNLLSKARNQELLMEDLQEERVHLQRALDETKEHYRAAEEERIHYQQRVHELSVKLAESHSAREEGVYRAARAIEELNLHALSPLRSSYEPPLSPYRLQHVYSSPSRGKTEDFATSLEGKESAETKTRNFVDTLIRDSMDATSDK